MTQIVGGFAVLAGINQSPDPYNQGQLAGITPVKLGSEMGWVMSRVVSPSVGLAQSWVIPVADPAYSHHLNECVVYEQSMALVASLAYVATNPTYSHQLSAGLIAAQQLDGSWTHSVDCTTAAVMVPAYRAMTQAWCVYSLLLYTHQHPTAPNAAAAATATTSGLAHLLSGMKSTSSSDADHGLIGAGFGTVTSNVYSPTALNYACPADTMMAWFCMQAYDNIHGVTTHAATMGQVQGTLAALWNGRAFPFIVAPTGPQTDDSLSVHMFGGFYSLAVGQRSMSALCLSNAVNFKIVDPLTGIQGYCFQTSNPVLWTTGVFQQAYLSLLLGDTGGSSLSVLAMATERNTDSSWNGAFDLVSGYSVNPWPSVMPTASAVTVLNPYFASLLLVPIP